MAIGTALAIAGTAASVGSGLAGAAAGRAQEREARSQQNRAIRAAKMTPQEMNEFQNQINQAERTLNRERKVLEAIDPTLIEAGKQAFELLQGKEAAILAPLRRQRQRQKKVLEESLRRRLGSDFETSSAGIEALTQFDLATSDVLANAQQSATSQLLQVTQSTRGQALQGEALGLEARSRPINIIQRAKERELNAITGTGGRVAETAGSAQRGAAGVLGSFGKLATFGAENLSQGKNFFGFGKVAAGSGDLDLGDPIATGGFSDLNFAEGLA